MGEDLRWKFPRNQWGSRVHDRGDDWAEDFDYEKDDMADGEPPEKKNAQAPSAMEKNTIKMGPPTWETDATKKWDMLDGDMIREETAPLVGWLVVCSTSCR